MKNNNRVLYIDIARGIAILLMIAGHTLNPGLSRSIIFSFHMPLFIIISGFFYKERSLKDEIKNSFFHLLIPSTIVIFLVQNIRNIGSMSILKSIIKSLEVILICFSHQSKIAYSFPNTGVLWFIYMIIIMKIIFILTKKASNNNELFMFASIVLETYLGYITGISGYWLPWSIDVALACIIFYYFGYLMKKYNLMNRILSDNYLLIIIFLLWLEGIRFNWIEIALRRYPNGLWSYITAICGSIIILKLSNIIEKKIKRMPQFLAWCGKNSLYILIAHYIGTSLFAYNININVNILNDTIKTIIIISEKYFLSIVFAYICTKLKEYFNKKSIIKK